MHFCSYINTLVLERNAKIIGIISVSEGSLRLVSLFVFGFVFKIGMVWQGKKT